MMPTTLILEKKDFDILPPELLRRANTIGDGPATTIELTDRDLPKLGIVKEHVRAGYRKKSDGSYVNSSYVKKAYGNCFYQNHVLHVAVSVFDVVKYKRLLDLKYLI